LNGIIAADIEIRTLINADPCTALRSRAGVNADFSSYPSNPRKSASKNFFSPLKSEEPTFHPKNCCADQGGCFVAELRAVIREALIFKPAFYLHSSTAIR
jgi:hypothetical protein